jgi:hypothetical protein
VFSISTCLAQEMSEDILCEDILRVKVQLDERKALENMSLNAQISQLGQQNNAHINSKSDNPVQNNLMIQQSGFENNAQLDTHGNKLNAGISQNGNSNNAELSLYGDNLDAMVSQSGSNNNIQGDIQGTNKQFFVSQKENQNSLKLNDISVNGIPAVIIEMNGKMAIEWDNGIVKTMPSQ